MPVTGYESWSPDEVADKLLGGDVQISDASGLMGAVIVLARRVAELDRDLRATKVKLRLAAEKRGKL